MKITYAHDNNSFVIRNDGREIARYATWSEFNQACQNLADVLTMLQAPKQFYDCKPTQEVSRG